MFASEGVAASEIHSDSKHIQHSTAFDSALAHDLATAALEPSVSTAQEALQRLEADRDLVLRLALQGFSGPEWEAFRTQLAKYGCAVIRSWCLAGKILGHSQRMGFGALPPPPREIDTDDALELALETVARALNYFREHALIGGGWDPAKGASLTTYFVGACIRCFANVYAGWRNENRSPPIADTMESDWYPATSSPPGVRMRLDRVLSGMPRSDRDLAAWNALGESHDEIAQRLKTTPKAVERRMHRLRNDVRNHEEAIR